MADTGDSGGGTDPDPDPDPSGRDPEHGTGAQRGIDPATGKSTVEGGFGTMGFGTGGALPGALSYWDPQQRAVRERQAMLDRFGGASAFSPELDVDYSQVVPGVLGLLGSLPTGNLLGLGISGYKTLSGLSTHPGTETVGSAVGRTSPQGVGTGVGTDPYSAQMFASPQDQGQAPPPRPSLVPRVGPKRVVAGESEPDMASLYENPMLMANRGPVGPYARQLFSAPSP